MGLFLYMIKPVSQELVYALVVTLSIYKWFCTACCRNGNHVSALKYDL